MAQETLDFADFELLVGAAHRPGEYSVNITQSPFGRAGGTLKLDLNAPQVKAVLEAIASRNTTEDMLIQFGSMLFNALLADPIVDVYRQSLAKSKRLRIRLCIEPPEISALPWEFLHDPKHDLFLAISDDHCISRYLQIAEPEPPLQVQLPLRVLIIVSDPSDLADYGLPPLKADEEIKRIQDALDEHVQAGRIKTDLLPHAVAADLRQKLRTFRPHVAHFIGHGGFQNNQGLLMMEDEDYRTRFVSERQFREFFLGVDDVKLVVLNVCEGATQSSATVMAGLAPQVVRRGLGAVVAMQYPIPDKVSLSFAREFYRVLAQTDPVDVAVAEARRAVYQDFGSDRRDWGTPVLFMRSPDGRLFGAPGEKQQPAQQSQDSTTIQVIGAGANLQGAQVSIGNVAGGNISAGNVVSTPLPALSVIESHEFQVRLHDTLANRFNVQELEDLCFSLNVPWDNLGAGTKSGKARELVDYMRRYSRLPELVGYIRTKRPDIQL